MSTDDASMGPRRWGRGTSDDIVQAHYAFYVLQWGRGDGAADRWAQLDLHDGSRLRFNGAAANGAADRPESILLMLREVSDWRCFNGAAAMGPRIMTPWASHRS